MESCVVAPLLRSLSLIVGLPRLVILLIKDFASRLGVRFQRRPKKVGGSRNENAPPVASPILHVARMRS